MAGSSATMEKMASSQDIFEVIIVIIITIKMKFPSVIGDRFDLEKKKKPHETIIESLSIKPSYCSVHTTFSMI